MKAPPSTYRCRRIGSSRRLRPQRTRPQQSTARPRKILLTRYTTIRLQMRSIGTSSHAIGAVQFSLPFSFWVVGILVGVAAALIVLALNTIFDVRANIIPIAFFGFIVSVWALVILSTIWRRGGSLEIRNPLHARTLEARAEAPSGAASLSYSWCSRCLASTMQLRAKRLSANGETYNIAFRGDPDLPDYSLRVMRNGTEIEIVGGFKYGLATDLRAAAQGLAADCRRPSRQYRRAHRRGDEGPRHHPVKRRLDHLRCQ